MIGGDDQVVSSYDIATHELVDLWHVGHPITCIACLPLEGGNFISAVGTETGQVLLRQGWDPAPSRQFTCSKPSKSAAHGATTSILDIKFSKNG
jgi:hypothetical protein